MCDRTSRRYEEKNANLHQNLALLRGGLRNVNLSTFGVNRYRLSGVFLGEAFPLVNSPNFVSHRDPGILNSCAFLAGL